MPSTGKAAEFYVSAELSRRKWNVVYLAGNFPDADLLIEKNGRKLWIQVKSYRPNASKAILKKQPLNRWVGNDKWYVFVSLDEDDLKSAPEHYYCISSTIVRNKVEKDHKIYIAGGNNRQDSDMRGFHFRDSDHGRIKAYDEKKLKKADRNFTFRK